MYVVCVHVTVEPDHVDAFVAATLENARATRREPGNLRFDVLRAREEPNKFMLYEVYRDESGMAAHKKTPHYAKWAEIANPIMQQKRVGVKYDALFPEDPEQWATE